LRLLKALRKWFSGEFVFLAHFSEAIMLGFPKQQSTHNYRYRSATLRIVTSVIICVTLMATAAKSTNAQGSSFAVPFNPNSVWNKPIGSNPDIHRNSAGMIQLLAGTTKGAFNIDGINGAWSVAVYEANSDTPVRKVCDRGRYRPCEMVRVPDGLLPSPDSDAKTVIVDRTKYPSRAWSFWGMRKGDGSNGDWTVENGAFGWGAIDVTGDGIHNYGGGEWGGRVTGWNYYAGLIQPEEIAQGHIDHALNLNIPTQMTAPGKVWPALGSNGHSGDPNAMQVGMRVQLDPSIDVETLKLSRGGKIIARALQVYGAYIGDTGSMAGFNARSYIIRNGSGVRVVDPTPWTGLLTYRDTYGFPVSHLRVVNVDPDDFFKESGDDRDNSGGTDSSSTDSGSTDSSSTDGGDTGGSTDTDNSQPVPIPVPDIQPRAPLLCVNSSGTIPANSLFNPVGTYSLLEGEVITITATHSIPGRVTAVYISGFGYAWGAGSASWTVTAPAKGVYSFSAGGGAPGKIFVELTATTTGPNC
jgi:hypothetical protein